MNVLTDDECRDIYNTAMEAPVRSAVSVTRAIEQAVIRKLAAGVSVEPSAYRFTENRGNGNTEFNYYGLDEVGMAYRDNCLEITPLYTATAIAAARGQENERCAKRMNDWRLHPMDDRNLCNAEAAIRALLGKEAT